MIKRFKDKITGKKQAETEDVDVQERGILRDRDRNDQTMEAITSAEAGAHDPVQETLQAAQTEKRKILVVSPADNCSPAVVDYAVAFAERMSYDIIVMNVLPLETHSPKLEPYCSVIHDEFKDSCEKNIVEFKKRCEDKGIGFLHLVKSGDVNQCIRQTHQQFRRIEFVVSDPVASPEVVKDGEQPIIPVFSLAY